jgi:hypothetical protein
MIVFLLNNIYKLTSYSMGNILCLSFEGQPASDLLLIIPVYCEPYKTHRPPLWYSGQSSWLQIRRPVFDSRHYQKKSSGSGTGSTQPREHN